MSFHFRNTSLELCQRLHCCHYRGEHQPACTGPGRDAGGMMIPGTHCPCQEFLSELIPVPTLLRGMDLNHRPLGYEPNELPTCSTAQNQTTPTITGEAS